MRHLVVAARREELPDVTHLAACLGIEGRVVENDFDLLAWPDRFNADHRRAVGAVREPPLPPMTSATMRQSVEVVCA